MSTVWAASDAVPLLDVHLLYSVQAWHGQNGPHPPDGAPGDMENDAALFGLKKPAS